MIKTLDFCILRFYDNYVICNVNEGENVTIEKSNEQTEVILEHYKDQPFVYITQRINSYYVDPNIYSDSSKIDTLLGFVVVSPDKDSVKNALFESVLLDKPFEVFDDLEDAVWWSNNLYELNKEV